MSRWTRRGQCTGRQARREGSQQANTPPLYLPVNERWQERQCNKLHLPMMKVCNFAREKPVPLLRDKEPCMVHETDGDGNCLFRCLSQVITGCESYHSYVRHRIVNHILRNCKAFYALLPEHPSSGADGVSNAEREACAQYLEDSKMANGATWGSDIEILAAAHLLHTRIYVYTLHGPAWQWVEHGLELTDPTRKACREGIYLLHTGLIHYDLVTEVRERVDGDDEKTLPNLALTSAGGESGAGQKSLAPHSRTRGCSEPSSSLRGSHRDFSNYRTRSSHSNTTTSSTTDSSFNSDDDSDYSGSVYSCDSIVSYDSISSDPSTIQYRTNTPRRPALRSVSVPRSRLPGARSGYNNNCYCFECRLYKLAVRGYRKQSTGSPATKTKKSSHRRNKNESCSAKTGTPTTLSRKTVEKEYKAKHKNNSKKVKTLQVSKKSQKKSTCTKKVHKNSTIYAVKKTSKQKDGAKSTMKKTSTRERKRAKTSQEK